MSSIKQVVWVGNSLTELRAFPEEVKDVVGYALNAVQEGSHPRSAKPLKGFKFPVMEMVSDYNTNTYRSVYTIQFDEAVYVLYCFQKKSVWGIKTPKPDINLIKQRLKRAEEIHKEELIHEHT